MKARPKNKKPRKKPTPKVISPEKAFIRAMLDFQSEIPVLPKSATGVNGNGQIYHYCPLPVMRTVLQPFLTKHGFIYNWNFKDTVAGDKKLKECTCIITHIEGHFRESNLAAELDNSPEMTTVQAVGSTASYLQRLTMIGALGLTSANEDNDGSSVKPKNGKSQIPAPQSLSEDLKNYDLKVLMQMVDRTVIEEALLKKKIPLGVPIESFTDEQKKEFQNYLIPIIMHEKG